MQMPPLAKAHRKALLAYLGAKLPPLAPPASKAAWLKRAKEVRRAVLASFFRGHPPGVLNEKPRVQWIAPAIETGHGYRIRKLRYEGYPGLWVPALLYEPERMRGRVPVVLNPNGHHHGGKAIAHKQARCINLAKRGMLALSTEFIGMGELRADADHNRIAHLDLCGIAGVGVFYLLMKRGLDVLLAHPRADPSRVAMTGLSGGGWQTLILSALDTRITASIPVAGHSPVWQRTACLEDMGDLEQVPSDLCASADYDVLTALLAPRPTLLIYNRNDDCCFQTRRTRKSIYEPVRPYFDLLGASANLEFYDNVDPGTHNYDADNRSQLYRFLNRHFQLRTPETDLPWQAELRTESDLNVGLPQENATLISLASQAAQKSAPVRRMRRTARSMQQARQRLASLLHLPSGTLRVQAAGRPKIQKQTTVRSLVLRMNATWPLAVTEHAPAKSKGVTILIGDGGRRNLSLQTTKVVSAGERTLAADLFGTGDAAVGWQHHMILASCGERSLGLQTGQLLALVHWACRRYRVPSVNLMAIGQGMSVVALLAAALQPRQVRSLTCHALLDSLRRLIEWPENYSKAAPLFCFGLLKEFDISDLLELSAPVPVSDAGRGPLRATDVRKGGS